MLLFSVEPLNKGQFGFRQFLIRLEVPGWMLSFVGGDNFSLIFLFLHMSFPIMASHTMNIVVLLPALASEQGNTYRKIK